MRKLIYRGAEQIFTFVGLSKNKYSFTIDNEFSVTPSTWADYYEMIAFDKSHTSIVDAKDPLSKTNLRRVSMYEYAVPEKLIKAQEQRDEEAKKERIHRELQKKYMFSITDKIASGIGTMPKDLEGDAMKFANKELLKLFPSKAEPIIEPVSGPEVILEPEKEVSDEVVSPDDNQEKSPL